MFVEFFYVMNMFNLRLTVPLVEMPLKYTIGEFTILKKLIFPRGGEIHINFVDIKHTHSEKLYVESPKLLVEFDDIFAKHQYDRRELNIEPVNLGLRP